MYNIVSALGFAVVAIYILYSSSTFPIDESSNVQPGSWPTFLAWVMLALSVLLVAETLIRRMLARSVAAGEGSVFQDAPAPFDFKSRGMMYVYTLCGLFVIFSVLLHYVNFTVASVVLIPGCMRLLGEKRPWMLAVVTAGVPVVVYVIFARILGIQLP